MAQRYAGLDGMTTMAEPVPMGLVMVLDEKAG